MLITVVWGSCVLVGKCDIEDSVALDRKNTKGFSLTGMQLYCELVFSSLILSPEWLCHAQCCIPIALKLPRNPFFDVFEVFFLICERERWLSCSEGGTREMYIS